MSVVSLANLSGPLLNQSAPQSPEIQAPQKSPETQANQESPNSIQDYFTPSSQNGQAQASAQAAGLFTVPQTPLPSSAAGSSQGEVPTSTSIQAVSQNSASSPANQPTVVAAATAPAPTSPPTTSSTYTQEELQPLNEALTSLGLSQQEIQKLDQIATITNDFSPAAFTAQAYQMEELALQTSQPVSSGASATANAANSNNQTANPAGSNLKVLVANS